MPCDCQIVLLVVVVDGCARIQNVVASVLLIQFMVKAKTSLSMEFMAQLAASILMFATCGGESAK